jgi:hypothetical protein
MSLHLINEIWKLLKPSIDAGDTDGAAETLVNYLVEEGVASTHEIKAAFRGDKEIKDALDFFMESPDDGLYHKADEDLFDDYDDYYSDDDEDEDY